MKYVGTDEPFNVDEPDIHTRIEWDFKIGKELMFGFRESEKENGLDPYLRMRAVFQGMLEGMDCEIPDVPVWQR